MQIWWWWWWWWWWWCWHCILLIARFLLDDVLWKHVVKMEQYEYHKANNITSNTIIRLINNQFFKKTRTTSEHCSRWEWSLTTTYFDSLAETIYHVRIQCKIVRLPFLKVKSVFLILFFKKKIAIAERHCFLQMKKEEFLFTFFKCLLTKNLKLIKKNFQHLLTHIFYKLW